MCPNQLYPSLITNPSLYINVHNYTVQKKTGFLGVVSHNQLFGTENLPHKLIYVFTID